MVNRGPFQGHKIVCYGYEMLERMVDDDLMSARFSYNRVRFRFLSSCI